MSLRRFNSLPSIPLHGRIKTAIRRRGSVAMNPRRAFTVIELIFVLIIISITAMLAAPRYANFLAEQRVIATANRIAMDVAMAQRRAKFSSTTQTITFTASEHTYSLAGVQDPDHPANPYVVSLTAEPFLAEIVSVDFGGAAKIVFDAYGVPDTNGTMSIRSGNRQKKLTLDGQTGRVTISDDVITGPPQIPEEIL
jgi:prepilin-type N-terminal cleavage/methylation domain-containing protein